MPASQTGFENAYVAKYRKDQADYDAQPNGLAQKQFTASAQPKICEWLTSNSVFKNWKAVVGSIDYESGAVVFVFSVGNGFHFGNADHHDLDETSDAYRVVSKLRAGDVVTISGQIILDPLSGSDCKGMPIWSLDQHQMGTAMFSVVLSAINGASALPPPPPPPSSEPAASDAEESSTPQAASGSGENP